MTYRIVRADPAGNITLFVLDPVAPPRRAAIAERLMARSVYGAEQVAFLAPPRFGGEGRLEMAGGEFCGNAVRALGLLLAKRRGAAGRLRLLVESSGCDGLIAVDVDTDAGTACAELPPPRSLRPLRAGEYEGTLVDLGGIAHFVTEAAPDEAALRAAEPELHAAAAAYGVIFLHDGLLTPLVKVPAAGTLIWEGSCGSGALAAAAAESAGTRDGRFARDYVQPAGTVRAEIERREGAIVSARIGGKVTLDEPVDIALGRV